MTTTVTVSGTAVTVTASNTAQAGTALWNANKLQGRDVAATLPTDTQALVWSDANSNWEPGSAGVSDHGALTGLGDDDHTQYAKLAGDTFTGPVLVSGTGDVLTSTAPTATDIPLVLQSAAGQTAALIEARFNGGTPQLVWDWPALVLYAGSGDANPTLTLGANDGGKGSVSGGTEFNTTHGFKITARDTGSHHRYPFAFGVSAADLGAMVTVTAPAATDIPLAISLAAAQTANAFEVRDSAATVLASFDSSGRLSAVLKDYGETVNAIGSIGGGTQDIDMELGNVATGTVDTSTTTFTFSNPPASGVLGGIALILTNGGSQTVNWPATVKWASGTAPTLTAAGVDILTFVTPDAGTNWYGFESGIDMQ